MGLPLSVPSRLLTFSICFFLVVLEVQATPLITDQCASLANTTNSTILLDQSGVPTTNQSQAWGIPYEACNALCGPLGGPGSFDWNFFSQGLSQWLLPWLALTAQLPFETKDKQGDFMALLLAVGSPALIVYSLALTILNSRSINRELRQIREDRSSDVHPQQVKVIKAARSFLIESQHVPIQIYNGSEREFAQLMVNPGNWAWWCNLREEIRKTKRKWTYSLYIQVAWVCLAQFWAIVAFFTSAADNTVIGNALAINCLWIWMIPVVLGWVYVGTQSSAGSIKAALSSVSIPILGTERNVRGECFGIRDRTTFNNPRMRLADTLASDDSHTQEHNQDGTTTKSQRLLSHRSSQPLRMFSSFEPYDEYPDHSEYTRQDIELMEYAHGHPKSTNAIMDVDVEQQPQTMLDHRANSSVCSDTFLGFSITGADLQPGPIYNYARFWSHMNAVNHVVAAFTLLTKRQRRKQTVHGGRWESAKCQWERNLNGSPEMMSKYISAVDKDVADIPVHVNELPVPVMNCILAAFVAISLQWGSVGSALLIAYSTPIVGIGCYAGSHLIYGLAATSAWLILVLSAYLSHRWSSMRETGNLRPRSILGPLAVLSRLIGKAIAIASALWVVTESVIPFTGAFESCWCNANGGRTGWVILFATDAEVLTVSRNASLGGVCMSITLTVIVTIYLFTSRGDEIFKHNSQ